MDTYKGIMSHYTFTIHRDLQYEIIRESLVQINIYSVHHHKPHSRVKNES